MIWMLTVSILWGSGLGFFVLKPLFSKDRKKLLFEKKLPLLFLGFFFWGAFSTHKAWALDAPPMAPKEVTIPPPSILPESGYWVPSVNQYVLTPQQGVLHVSYLGLFSNTFHAKSTKVLLPFPKNVDHVRLEPQTQATLETIQSNEEIILDLQLKEGVNEIQGDMDLSTLTSVVHWQSNTLAFLPGVVLFMMPSQTAQLLHFPKDFHSIPGDQIQFVRVGNDQAPFPQFTVENRVPSRAWIFVLITCFVTIFLVASGLFFLKKA